MTPHQPPASSVDNSQMEKSSVPDNNSKKSDKNEEKKINATSNKRTRESWNYQQTSILVKLWKENINLLKSSRCNETWFHIRKELCKHGPKKSKKQCTDKLRNLKELYKKAKENNPASGAAPETSPFYQDFDEILGCRDIMNIPELKEVGSAEKSCFDHLNELEKSSCNSKQKSTVQISSAETDSSNSGNNDCIDMLFLNS